ncbi:WD40 repeat-like protein [Leucogyrophana mollusca]|uniref:WD40 repeat-like protein n=1 Tax=Leucogyrophana mollusca TaxID=85980 RepID=A0ACB8BW70_9AGAM|nr:WD40 repeat-like protein [Leucogyrophana mollusca]
MHLQETILCATGSSSSSGPGAITLHDIHTGSSLASFKQTTSSTQSTAFVETRDGHGGFLLAAQADKSVLNVYNFQKDQLTLKIILPERLSCIAVDRRGGYCAGGTSQGRIYLWEVASGILYNSWDAHYRQVNVLKFTHDGAALVSGSEDSGVGVWSVSRLVDDDLQNELVTPYCTLSDHTLPVTDIICGFGAFPTCRILTASVDHTVKLWDITSHSLLTTFHFPQPISCIAWDVTERLFFAASVQGSIHQVNLFRQRASNVGGQVIEAVGGAGATDVIRIGDEDEQGRRKRLISVGQPITTLALSLTTSLLLVGTATGLILVHDVASHQLLRTISTHKGVPITHLATLLKPPDLFGHISLNLSPSVSLNSADLIPVRPVAPFQRMRDAKAREAHEVAMILPVQQHENDDSYTATSYTYPQSELIRDHAYFVQPTLSDSSGKPSNTARVAELEAEVQELREQLGKAKGVNDMMWETVVQRVISQGKEKEKLKLPQGTNGTQNEASNFGMEAEEAERDSGRTRKKERR